MLERVEGQAGMNFSNKEMKDTKTINISRFTILHQLRLVKGLYVTLRYRKKYAVTSEHQPSFVWQDIYVISRKKSIFGRTAN